MFQTRMALLTALFATALAWAQVTDEPGSIEVEVVVTAHRDETNADEVGSSFTVLNAEDIERSGADNLADVLRQVPGLDVVRSGLGGQTTSLFTRGSGNAHTLVLLDGLPLNDPISPNNAYDFALFSLENIDRIEVVRGPQSTLYGSDAMAGVVHIITKKGQGRPGGSVDLQAGSYGLRRERIRFGGGGDKHGYSLSVAHMENDGLSAARGGEEKDGYRNNSVSLRLNAEPSERLSFELVARHTDAKADLDNGPGMASDDPNHVSETVETTVKLGGGWRIGAWSGNLSLATLSLDRDLFNGFDDAHLEDSVDALYRGDRLQMNWQNSFELGQGHRLLAGVEHEDEEGRSSYQSESVWGSYVDVFDKRDSQTTSLYLQDHLRVGRAALTLGGRYDDHDRFGDHTTWRATGSVALVAHTWLKLSLGTGFKAPSLFQLFSSFGNQALQPEESDGWDVGFRYEQNRLAVNLGFFRNEMENLIDYDLATSTYVNLGDATMRGAELDVAWHGENGFDLRGSYTFTEAEDDDGEQLVRRPRRKASLSLGYQFQAGTDVGLNVRHVGPRNFNDFIDFSGVVREEDYTVLGATGRIPVSEMFTLSLALENLLDENYQEVHGYSTAGASGSLSLRFNY